MGNENTAILTGFGLAAVDLSVTFKKVDFSPCYNFDFAVGAF
jgi:hypothetical protein